MGPNLGVSSMESDTCGFQVLQYGLGRSEFRGLGLRELGSSRPSPTSARPSALLGKGAGPQRARPEVSQPAPGHARRLTSMSE